MNKNEAANLAHMMVFGRRPTNDDLLSYKRGRCLKAALNEITRLMLDRHDKLTALADIPTEDGGTVADLPSIVATAISKPWGSLGLDTSPEWGATTSDWYTFQHQAENFIRWKIDLVRMRKFDTSAQRLHLALGCLQWAGVLGVHDVPGFQSHFTTAIIFDRDATAELNGETIDVAPLETDVPLDRALLMQIAEKLGNLRQDFANFGDKVKRIEATAERAAQEAERAADLISTLRTEWLTGEEKAPTSRIEIVGTVKMRIYGLWKEYKTEHDPDDNGGRKADFGSFLETYGGREISIGMTLQELIEQQSETDEKHRSPEELVKRIIKTEQQNQRNRATQGGQKPKSSQKANHK